MDSMILELQREAAQQQLGCTDLLRMALMVAAKLKLADFEVWVRRELNGYTEEDDVPDYRIIRGDLQTPNPYSGTLIPIRFRPEVMESLSDARLRMAIGHLEAVAKEPGGDFVELRFSEQHTSDIRHATGEEWVMPFLKVPTSQLSSIFDAVRNKVLEWALRLEQEGIVGQGYTFTSAEKEKATVAMQNFNIQNFSGVLGPVSHSTVNVTDYSTVHGSLKALGIGQAERNELESIMDDYSQAPTKDKPGIVAKAIEWIDRHKAVLGPLLTGLRRFFGLA